MLKQINGAADFSKAAVPISQAAFPSPFDPGLEFNTPEHSHWNIVHIGMQLPESRQIYICGDNCMRGVVMTAGEMAASDRFGMVLLKDEDLLDDDLTQVTLDGIVDCIEKWQTHPKAVLVFPVCIHHFMGTDMDQVYEALEEKYPDIFWLKCWMDPIMQKRGTTPDERERLEMTRPLYDLPEDLSQANLIGIDVPAGPSDENDLTALLKRGGVRLNEIGRCRDFETYRQTGAAGLELYVSQFSKLAAEGLAKRLKRPCLFMDALWNEDEIDASLNALADFYGWDIAPWLAERKALAEKAVQSAKAQIGEMPIAIDTVGVLRPLSLARMLTAHGFNVVRIYADGFSEAEREDYLWLQQNADSLTVCSTLRPEMRRWPEPMGKVLAIGPRAAWFEKSPTFVQMIENGGLWGYGAWIGLMKRMAEACASPKAVKPVITQKGWGCACSL
ncbi:MAG: nitrogenase component 1 [Pseudoramibacter sp.]